MSDEQGAFGDRAAAGRALAASLDDLARGEDALVLALPRGGVPVAVEVARRLGLPLDVIVTAKLRTPGQEELALGAVGPGGVKVRNEDLGRSLRLPQAALDSLEDGARREARRRERAYRGDAEALELRGRTVVLVDDGLATGASMRAAVVAARNAGAARVVVAVPVGASDTCAELRREADELRCLLVPRVFRSVGEFYRDFHPVDDDEVRRHLAASRG